MANREAFVALSVFGENIHIVHGIFSSHNVEGIEELATGIKGYWPQIHWDKIQDELLNSIEEQDFSFKIENIPFQNWNKKWEANFESIYVSNFCCIRAPFHKLDKKVKHEIIIEPKMAFGTGHHATTFQLIDQMAKINIKNKRVLDYGTGTGVLAIIAEKMNAKSVLAIDNDISAYENTMENLSINECSKIEVRHSTIEDLKERSTFDIILANINRNILMNSVAEITNKASTAARLLMSGFYVRDLPDIQKVFADDWSYHTHTEKEGWCCVILKNKNP